MPQDDLVERVARALEDEMRTANRVQPPADPWPTTSSALALELAAVAIEAMSAAGNDGIVRMLALAASQDPPEGFEYEYRAVVRWEDGAERAEEWSPRNVAEHEAEMFRTEMAAPNDLGLVEMTDVWLERRLVGPPERLPRPVLRARRAA